MNETDQQKKNVGRLPRGIYRRDLVTTSLVIVALISAWGLFCVRILPEMAEIRPFPFEYNIYFRLFYLFESPFFIFMALFAASALLVVRSSRPLPEWASAALDIRATAMLAVGVLIACRLGSRVIMHDYDFSMDEFASAFQARILAAGHVAGVLAKPWWRFGKGLTPAFVTYDATSHSWMSSYLPVHAALRAVFLRLGIEAWLNPFLASCSILLIHDISIKVWPGSKSAPLYSVVLLAASPQFLFTSMTGYAMPTELVANLAWLDLYLRGTKTSWTILPWVGALAIGIHNPMVHILFAAPFLVRVLRSDKAWWALYFSLVYVPASILWRQWLSFVHPVYSGSQWVSIFRRPRSFQMLLQSMNLTLVLSWLTPLAGILVVLAFLRWRSQCPAVKDLIGGALLVLAFYCFYPSDQGHGWGYRYAYGVLGNFALMGSAASETMGRGLRSRMTHLLTASAAASVLIQLPVRGAEIEAFMRPFSRAAAYVRRLPEPVVAVDPAIGWYAQDLVRNDPFLRSRPMIINTRNMSGAALADLGRAFGGRIHVLKAAELAALGYPGEPAAPTDLARP